MNELKAWYSSQTRSSQVLVALAALMLILFFLYEYMLDPWKGNLHNLRLSVETDTETAAWMENEFKQNQRLIIQSSKQVSTGDRSPSESLITRVEQSAKSQNIFDSIERISPDKVGRVKVWINNANFSLWLDWVDQLKQEGIDVVDARVSQANSKSPVTINVTFSRVNSE